MISIPKYCTGCTACVSICPNNCIKMEKDKEGFVYPKINKESCIECGLCEKVCPIINCYGHETDLMKCYAIKNINYDERIKSSSGGMFSLIANDVINQFGKIYGAAYNNDFLVHHVCVNRKEDISLLQGAKYTQSELNNCFQKVKTDLINGDLVLFSGTPCQCAGLHSFLGKKYNNLIMIDFVCHGVPSPKLWQFYIDYRSKQENGGNRPISINMRSKKTGWSKYSYSTEFIYENKSTLVSNNCDLFMKSFIGNLCLRKSCMNCKNKGSNRYADLTLGDYWGIWNQYPEFDDNRGVSVVFIHSDKGHKILNRISEKCNMIPVSLNDAMKENRSYSFSSIPHKNRDAFLALVNDENFENTVIEMLTNQNRDIKYFFKKLKMFFK
ncbi:MAG: Coenzyme F420 hydrogenase/dehydrogenase, beta subunit C-terminal domain [Merdibacter sp.]|nr:Coenzyme F420 hydrogenase/dehydrogenase, beta subunit C-terminal domain [Merdibacter sp.]